LFAVRARISSVSSAAVSARGRGTPIFSARAMSSSRVSPSSSCRSIFRRVHTTGPARNTSGEAIAAARERPGGYAARVSPSSIARVSVKAVDIPLHKPFGISGGAQAVANNALIEVELEDRTIGYGEAAPLPPFNGETQAAA